MQRDDKSPSVSSSRCGDMDRCHGFTLLEIVLVLVLFGILSVFALSNYFDIQGQSRKAAGQLVVAAAQSQLSLEFARRAASGLTLAVDAQQVCDDVVVSSSTETSSLVCTGNLTGTVTVTATINATPATGSWVSPVAGGS